MGDVKVSLGTKATVLTENDILCSEFESKPANNAAKELNW